jgi:hypothetical protein
MLNKDNFQTSFTSVYLRKKILHGLLIYKKKNIINLLFDNVKVKKFVKSLKYKMSFPQQEKINIIFTYGECHRCYRAAARILQACQENYKFSKMNIR